MKQFFAKIFAWIIVKKINFWAKNPEKIQKKVFLSLIENAKHTSFGRQHHFENIKSFKDFVQSVPIRSYEDFSIYIQEILSGKENVLWQKKPLYMAKTSGTTSGVKYIPITEESIKYQVSAARDAILCYINETKNTHFVDGKMIFLQGSPLLNEKNGIKIGRLSGISAHFVPNYLQKNRLPSWETNCIEDWESKVDAIVEETIPEDMTLISGIPAWVQMYFEKIVKKTQKPVGEVFKNFSLFIYGGVNYEPYRNKFENLIGRKVDSIELFPASEGFFAFQNKQNEKGMLLLLNSGIFYEFIKVEDFFSENPKRLTIGEVELGVNYVMIISTNAGLWAYNLGDTIEFVSKNPYKIIVTGRISHFISAFGEHIIAKEVETALKEALQDTDIQVNEFSVAPQVTPEQGELPYHQWLIEFENQPENLEEFAQKIDKSLQKQNIYYFDLREGNIIQKIKIEPIKKGVFSQYMKQEGKLGGQNKLPRLTNDRKLADKVLQINSSI